MTKKKTNNKKLNTFILMAAIILAIIYAIITTSVILKKEHERKNSLIKVDEVEVKPAFYVHYIATEDSPKIIKGTGTASISEDKTSATFAIQGMSRKGDKAIVEYTILNESEGQTANLDINITNSNTEFFKVDKKLDATIIHEQQITKATITIELIKTPINTIEKTLVTGDIVATPM